MLQNQDLEITTQEDHPEITRQEDQPEITRQEDRDEVVFIHTFNPFRTNLLLEKFSSKNQKNINSTLVILRDSQRNYTQNIPINIYANTDWKGFASIVFKSGANGVIFYGGFPNDIGSDYFFNINVISDNKVEQLSDIGKTLKRKRLKSFRNADFWGNFTLASQIEKFKEIAQKKASRSRIFSSTKYFVKNSLKTQPIVSNKHREPDGIEQRHNECHITPTLIHIKSVTITKNDFTKRYIGEILSDNINLFLINSRHVTQLIAQKMQQDINIARKKISKAEDDESKRELEHCIDVEISKSTIILQKIALFNAEIKYNDENNTLLNNKKMQLAFNLKARKERNFKRMSSVNQQIWIRSQNNYLRQEINNLLCEIKELRSCYNFEITSESGKENLEEVANRIIALFEDPSNNFLQRTELCKKEIQAWQEKTKQDEDLRKLIKDKIVKDLQKDIPITIYDKEDQSITETSINVSAVDLKRDRLIIYQLVMNNLGEKINELYPDEEERKNAILECSSWAKGKELEELFYKALASGNIQVLEILLEQDSKLITQRNGYGNTALIIASANGHTEIVKHLLEKGAKIDAQNNIGNTALMVASTNGHTEIVEKLLEKGANANISNMVGKTPIYKACKRAHSEVVKILFEAGANTDLLRKKTSMEMFLNFSQQFDIKKFKPEMQELIKEITNPEKIKFRDEKIEFRNKTLARKEISERQIEFNAKQNEIIASNHFRNLEAIYLANALLFLKFVASEFSEKKSNLTQDEKISEMLKIYLKENKLLRFIIPSINNIITNKNGLKVFLINQSTEQLINLSNSYSIKYEISSPLAENNEEKIAIATENSEKQLEIIALKNIYPVTPRSSFFPLSLKRTRPHNPSNIIAAC